MNGSKGLLWKSGELHRRNQARSFLQPEWQIVEGCDGLEAVQKATQLRPDIVLLDVGMPVMNGIEAAKQIRQKSAYSKVLFLTQNNDGETKAAALETGAEGYVLKSEAANELIPAITAALRDGHR